MIGIEDVIKKINLSSFTSRLSKLNGNKSTGFDSIHELVLKNRSASMAKTLTHIFLKSLKERKIPNGRKYYSDFQERVQS